MDSTPTSAQAVRETEASLSRGAGFASRLSPKGRAIAARGLGMVGAAAVMPLAVILPEKLAPHQLEKLNDHIAHQLILPHLDRILPAYNRFKLNSCTQAQLHDWEHMTPEEKAKDIACEIGHDALYIGSGFAANAAGTKIAEKLLHAEIPNRTLFVMQGIDAAVTLGSIAVINTALAKETKKGREVVGDMLKKVGFSDSSAAKTSTSLVSFTAPDLIGSAAGVGYLIAAGTKGRV